MKFTTTALAVALAGISLVFGFAMIWHIWWLAGLSFAGLIGTAIAPSFNYDRDYHIPADEVTRTEDAHTRELAAQEA